MCFRQHRAHFGSGLAGIGQVIDDQHAFAAVLDDLRCDTLQHLHLTLRVIVMIGGDADGFDHPDVEFAGNDGGRHQAAAGDTDHGAPFLAVVGKAPRKRARVTVELVPGDRKGFIGQRHQWAPACLCLVKTKRPADRAGGNASS
ncbi:hypothetical protein D9M70_575300 [compost metagenome]